MTSLDEKRRQIKRSEKRIAYFERMITERPRFFGVWRYWLHWYRMRRISWLTELWLQQVHKWKDEIRKWEQPGRKPNLERAKEIRKNVKGIESQIPEVESQQEETEQLARERNWHIRYPRPHTTMLSYIAAKRRRLTRIKHWIDEIYKELPAPLYRIKIRLYNMEHDVTPKGMFQGFFEIDAIIDPETELVNWKWWLTQEELELAKVHMIGYFKGMNKWHDPEQLELGFFDDKDGIPSRDKMVTYKHTRTGKRLTKNVPPDVIEKAQTLTIEELILGESSKVPKPNPEPTLDNMGILFQRVMIIKDNQIVWDEMRHKWITPPPTQAQLDRVKEELGLE
jgi:hypothetical protein